MRCQIQWIDAQGDPSPDDNEAIAFVECMDIPSAPIERTFPICAMHVKWMKNLPNWRFVPTYYFKGWR